MSRKPLIAIVDDDPFVCRAMKRLVWARGIDAETFESGRRFVDALETVPSFQPDCVILDVDMPDLDGFGVLKHLVTRRPDIPVIFVTAHDDARARALEGGAVAFFRKPLNDDLDDFVSTLHALLGMEGRGSP